MAWESVAGQLGDVGFAEDQSLGRPLGVLLARPPAGPDGREDLSRWAAFC